MRNLYLLLPALLLSLACKATLGPISGNTNICTGTSTTLSNATAGGTWSCASIFAVVDPATGLVTGTSAGNALVTYSVGPDTVYQQVTVAGALSNIYGSTALCTGATYNYNCSPAGGTWSSSNTAAVNINTSTGQVPYPAVGAATITYSAAPGCTSILSTTVTTAPSLVTGERSMCLGSSVSLSDSVAGGIWSSAGNIATVTPATGVVTGVAPGSAVVAYTMPGGCFKSAIVYVANPTAVISGYKVLCAGSTGTLAYGIPNGVWSSSNSAIATINATNGSLSAVTAGSTIVAYTINGCTAATTTITVTNTVPPILGLATACTGANTWLSNDMGGGTWSSSNPAIATLLAPGVVRGVNAGTTTISYSVGGCTPATFIMTSAGAIPDITGTGSMCAPASTTLNNAMPGGTWSINNTTVATVNPMGVVSSASGGDAIVSYTMSSGCSATFGMRIYPPPAELFGCNNIGIGDTTTLRKNLINSAWSSSNNSIAQVNSDGLVRGISAGTATISMYAPVVGCLEGYKTINVTPTALVKPIIGYNLICKNTSTTLSTAIPGGIWSSSSTAIATVNATGTVTGVSFGRNTISYATTSGAACTLEMYINNLPSAITGPASICVGEAVSLSSEKTYNIWISRPMSYFNPENQCTATPFTYLAWGLTRPYVIDCYYLSDEISFTTSDSSIAIPEYYYRNTINGINAGVATIKATQGYTGCSVTQSLTVMPSTAGPVTGARAICIGMSTTLSYATAGGTWSSSNPAVATVSGSGTVMALSAGTTTITYAIGPACGKTLFTMTMNPTPAAIAGNTGYVCVGATRALSNAISGGVWSSNNTAVATVDPATGTVTGLAPGAATITYMMPPCGNYATTTISVNNNFPIVGNRSLCAGSTTMLSNVTGTATWSSSDVNVASVPATFPYVTGVTQGTAVISAVSTCGTATATVTVYGAQPVSGPSAVCIGSTVSLATTAPGGTWYTQYTALATVDNNGVVYGIANGSTVITYTAITGCKTFKNLTVSNIPLSNITGGGAYCTGGTGVPIGISAMTAGVSYQLYNGTTAIGAPHTTTSGGLSFGLQTATGSYYILASNGGCTRTMSGTATVSITPGVTPIIGSTTVCSGYNSVPLTNETAGGTWGSSNTTVVNVSSGYLYGLATGSATIRYTTACGTATMPVTVNPIPTITWAGGSGIATLCSKNYITLSSDIAGGTWSSSNTYLATIDASGLVYGITGGNTVLYMTNTLPTGCKNTGTIYYYQTPAISAPHGLCTGEYVQLSSDYTSGGTWSSATPSVATVTASGYAGTAATGNAVFSFTTAQGCTGTGTIVVSSACAGTPTPGNAWTNVGATCPYNIISLHLSGGSAGCGIRYQWQISTDSLAWTDIPINDTTGTYYPSVTSWFRCAVTCLSSTITAYSSPARVLVAHQISSAIVPVQDTACQAVHFNTYSCMPSTSASVVTWFGDGTSSTSPFPGYTLDVYHNYSLPGTYTVKQVLLISGIPADSTILSYTHNYCRTLPIKFYQDFNSNCVFDAGDNANMQPVTVAIDSNGTPLDTVIVTSGLYYPVRGATGTIYKFRVISVSGGRSVTCPLSATLSDTITSAYTYAAKYFGLGCTPSVNYDLAIHGSVVCTPTIATGNVYVTNSFCTPTSPVVTMHISPKYQFVSSTPTPASVLGSTVTWNLPPVSASGVQSEAIYLRLAAATTLIPGDTAHFTFNTGPVTGDVNMSNNDMDIISTVTGSYDPNNLEVAPGGQILPCQKLLYTVNFENLGNATAKNVHVLDTLPTGLDIRSVDIVKSSAALDLTVISSHPYNVIRFDLPGINLADSSQRDKCHGMFQFNVRVDDPLPDGTVIPNRVGIYFDDNPVVMTNTVHNITGMDSISGPVNICIGAITTLSSSSPGGTWTSASTAISVSATGVVSSYSAGMALVSYTISNGCQSRSKTKTVVVSPTVLPAISAWQSPAGALCAGSTVSLSALAVNGGTAPVYEWKRHGGTVATGASYTYPVTTTDTIVSMLTSNVACALRDTASTTIIINVNNAVTPSASLSRSPAGVLCMGVPVTFSASSVNGGSSPGYSWKINGLYTGTSGTSYTYYPAHNDVVTFTMNSNAPCATPLSASQSMTVSINPTVTPAVNITRLPAGMICSGTPVTFTANPANGGTTPLYRWKVNGVMVGGAGNTYTYSPINNDQVTSEITSNASCLAHDTATSNIVVTTIPAVVPTLLVTSYPAGAVCAGTPVTLSAVATNTGSIPLYEWLVNGISTGTSGNTYSFIPTGADLVKTILTSNAPCASPATVSTTTTINAGNLTIPTLDVLPAPGNHIAAGTAVTFTAVLHGGTAATTYKWMINGATAGGASSPVFAYDMFADNDSVTCQATTTDGACTYTTFNSVIMHLSTNAELTAGIANIQMTPNPNSGSFTIQGAWYNETVNLDIIDMPGRVLYSRKVTIHNAMINEQVSIAHDIANGVYLLRLTDGIHSKLIHFVVNK